MSLGGGLVGSVAFLLTEGGGKGGCTTDRRELAPAFVLLEKVGPLVSTGFDTDNERSGGGSM